MFHSTLARALAAATLLAAVHAEAKTPASLSLAKCQKTAAKAAQRLQRIAAKRIHAAYIKATDDLIGKEQAEISPKTAQLAVKNLAHFDKTALDTSPEVQKFKDTVSPVCDPASNQAALAAREVQHTVDDVLDTLQARRLGARCAKLGGPSEIDTVDDWEDCMALSAIDDAEKSVATNVPAGPDVAGKIMQALTDAPPPDESPADVAKAIATTDQTNKSAVPDGATSGFAQFVKLAFVTSRGIGSAAFGGLAGGDQFCQDSAVAAGLAGTFKAWLSDDSTSAASRLTQASIPYLMVDGTKLADDWADLTDGTLDAPFVIDELGQSQVTPEVWTGTTAAGDSIPSSNCSGWTSSSGAQTATVGVGSNTDSTWTDAYLIFCSGVPLERLYCLQQ